MCCGSNRELLRRSRLENQPVAQSVPTRTQVEDRAPTVTVIPPRLQEPEVVFELRGSNELIAIGGITGRRYHFVGPGARVRVDVRERELLSMIEGLVAVDEPASAH